MQDFLKEEKKSYFHFIFLRKQRDIKHERKNNKKQQQNYSRNDQITGH